MLGRASGSAAGRGSQFHMREVRRAQVKSRGPSSCSALESSAQPSPGADLRLLPWKRTPVVGGGHLPYVSLHHHPQPSPSFLVFLLAAIRDTFISLVKSLMMPGCAAGLRLNPSNRALLSKWLIITACRDWGGCKWRVIEFHVGFSLTWSGDHTS